MKLKQIKDDHFDGSFKKMAEAGNISTQSLRNMISDEREGLTLKDGRFILTSDRSIIFEVEKVDYSDSKERPEGYYKIEDPFELRSIAYWSGKEWLFHGEETEYWDDELNIESIELVEFK